MKHKPIPKALRKLVYEKYNGHCAYCGCELEYKDMQVDHIDSLWYKHCDNIENKTDFPIQDDRIENLMPSCRQCNFYKGACDIEEFRNNLKILNLKFLSKFNLQLKLAIKYGFIKEMTNWNGGFYFEGKPYINEKTEE